MSKNRKWYKLCRILTISAAKKIETWKVDYFLRNWKKCSLLCYTDWLLGNHEIAGNLICISCHVIKYNTIQYLILHNFLVSEQHILFWVFHSRTGPYSLRHRWHIPVWSKRKWSNWRTCISVWCETRKSPPTLQLLSSLMSKLISFAIKLSLLNTQISPHWVIPVEAFKRVISCFIQNETG